MSAPTNDQGQTDTGAWQATAGTVLFFITWFGGLTHALAINRSWLAWLENPMRSYPTLQSIPEGINPNVLGDPWRSFVTTALSRRNDLDKALSNLPPSSFSSLTKSVSERFTNGIRECWQIASSGQRMTVARGQIDTPKIIARLTELEASSASSPDDQTRSSTQDVIKSLRRQLEVAERLDARIKETYFSLITLDARLGEVVVHAIELSARPTDPLELRALDSDIESIVDELSAMRIVLDEIDESSA